MKKTALRRVTGLACSTTRMRPRSRKLAKVYREVRVPLVRRLLAERPAWALLHKSLYAATSGTAANSVPKVAAIPNS